MGLGRDAEWNPFLYRVRGDPRIPLVKLELGPEAVSGTGAEIGHLPGASEEG